MPISLLTVISITILLLNISKVLCQNESLSVNLEKASYTVSDQFLSVTIGSHSIQHNWYNLSFKSLRLINMGKALAPAMLRIGGTDQDYLLFNETAKTESYPHYDQQPRLSSDQENYTMSAEQWDAINQYVLATGWDIIFGLNVFLRNPWPQGDWDTTNAEQLMNYTISKGYQVNWELGNEPNLFPKLTNTTVISAEQLAKDFGGLKKLVENLHLKPTYIAGPDISQSGTEYLKEFLKALPIGTINALTWHQYYEGGANAVLPDFFNSEVLDKFLIAANTTWNEILQHNTSMELWLGETSSCSGGGAPVLSSSYVAGFMWLDKLGIAAITGHKRVFRQAFIAGNYGLLDTNGNPLPDFWLSVIYKKLVGTIVLDVNGSTKPGRHNRVYAHCAKRPLYPAGSVVLLILNVNTFNTSIFLNDHELISSRRDVYWLTPPGGIQNILSKQVTLNRRLLELVNNSTIPDLDPAEQNPSKEINIPTLSFGFYVFKDAKAKACM